MCNTRIFNSSRQASERLTPLLAKNNLFKADGCSATAAAFSALLTLPRARAANTKWAPGEHTDCLGLTWKCLLLPAPNTTQRCSNRSNRTKKKTKKRSPSRSFSLYWQWLSAKLQSSVPTNASLGAKQEAELGHFTALKRNCNVRLFILMHLQSYLWIKEKAAVWKLPFRGYYSG